MIFVIDVHGVVAQIACLRFCVGFLLSGTPHFRRSPQRPLVIHMNITYIYNLYTYTLYSYRSWLYNPPQFFQASGFAMQNIFQPQRDPQVWTESSWRFRWHSANPPGAPWGMVGRAFLGSSWGFYRHAESKHEDAPGQWMIKLVYDLPLWLVWEMMMSNE